MSNNSPLSLAELGTHFYRHNFGYRYAYHADPNHAPTDWLLFPDSFYSSFLLPVEGQSVAIVGNGEVKGRGKMIDEQDSVIRINYPYRWKQDPLDDGQKLTIWAGLAKNEVFHPEHFQNPPVGFSPNDLTEMICQAKSLHCISHHHVQAGFWSDVCKLGVRNKFHAHWSAPVIFNEIEPTPYGENSYLLSWITNRSYLDSGYGGWYGWDTLLSGVRILLMTAMSKPKSIKILGMNFYDDGYRQPWDMHKLDINLEVFRKTIHICRELGISAEIIDNER